MKMETSIFTKEINRLKLDLENCDIYEVRRMIEIDIYLLQKAIDIIVNDKEEKMGCQ
ncbi:hypothetical protein [Niallia taxi]|uniref:hypothetical protein n=1 Tax=Niallia taxi TaxID=2499688 RepID=UPI002E1C8DE8|nr:hypothetical protein [Niallia taxi]